MLCHHHGHPWRIQTFPGGLQANPENEPYISICLEHEGDTEVKVIYAIRISTMIRRSNAKTFDSANNANAWRYKEFLLRRDVLDPARGFLKNGTLVVEVDIQVYSDAPQIYIPQK
jgi:hypothetical protein